MSDEHATHHVNYLMVFISLCLFTFISVVCDLVEIPNKLVLIVLVLGVAVAKALCVMAFFMHLKFEGRWKFVLLCPTVILALGLPLALLPDVGLHYYHLEIPQNDKSISVSHHVETEQPAENNGH